MRRFSLFIIFFLMGAALYGCGDAVPPEANGSAAGISFTLDENNRYTGFDALPENYTPEKALADGCLVVTGSERLNSRSEVYGGGEKWDEFLEDTENGQDSALRYVMFLDGEPYFQDLFFHDGRYRMFDNDRDTTDVSFQYLRRLTGQLSGTAREGTVYVLTDSLELTYRDVMWSFLSSNLDSVTDIPFQWVTFTIYLM